MALGDTMLAGFGVTSMTRFQPCLYGSATQLQAAIMMYRLGNTKLVAHGPSSGHNHMHVTTKSIQDLVGITRFRDERLQNVHAAEALALYQGIDDMGDDNVTVLPKLGLAESVLLRVDHCLGPRAHSTRHRAANKFAKVAKLVKVLTEQLKAEAPFTFTNSAADLRALSLATRSHIKEAIEKGVEIPDGRGGWTVVKLNRADSALVRRGMETAYFIRTEYDDFYERLAQSASKEVA
jgi:hypothetical protein